MSKPVKRSLVEFSAAYRPFHGGQRCWVGEIPERDQINKFLRENQSMPAIARKPVTVITKWLQEDCGYQDSFIAITQRLRRHQNEHLGKGLVCETTK